MIKKVLKAILNKLPGGNYIVFESLPLLADNTRAVFDEMLRRGMQRKYRFCWIVKEKNRDLPQFPNTEYICTKGFWNELRYNWVTLRAKCIVCCNVFVPARLPRTKSVYLTHGTTVKKLNGYVLPEGIHYTLVAGEGLRQLMAQELCGDSDTFYALGYPRNDVLTQPDCDLHKYLEGDFDKVIVWYPTFRQHQNGIQSKAGNALPILHDPEKAQRLNEVARANRVLVVIKPHFAQDLRYIQACELSNIRFIDDAFFTKNGISSYAFVGSCDALISDYSSIYFDYLLCDKPQAVVWEDLEDYRQAPGIAIDLDHYMMGAEKVYTPEQLEQFVIDVAQGVDRLQSQRAQICGEVNYARDGKNAARVTDFIVENCGL